MSKTSFTRMRMPRMQGRPEHWLGSIVMRFIALAFNWFENSTSPCSTVQAESD
jgi:hypothetical protein